MGPGILSCNNIDEAIGMWPKVCSFIALKFSYNTFPRIRAVKLQQMLIIQKYERKMVLTGEKTTCFEDGDHHD